LLAGKHVAPLLRLSLAAGGAMKSDPQVVAVVESLACYLRANPLASDTAEGICRWWLDRNLGSMKEVMQALEVMQHEHLIEPVVAADGRLRYRRVGTDAQFDRLIADSCGKLKV
jgi:hypothetical protein